MPSRAGLEPSQVCDRTLYIMAGLLFLGLICTMLIRPVKEELHMTDEEVDYERSLQHDDSIAANAETAALF